MKIIFYLDRYSIERTDSKSTSVYFLQIFQLIDSLFAQRKLTYDLLVRGDDIVLNMNLEIDKKSKFYTDENLKDVKINTDEFYSSPRAV